MVSILFMFICVLRAGTYVTCLSVALRGLGLIGYLLPKHFIRRYRGAVNDILAVLTEVEAF